MNLLFVECNMGIAGDMFLSALLDLFEDKEAMIEELNQIGIPGVKYQLEQAVKCGITGTHVRVFVEGEEETSSDVPLESGTGHDHGHSHEEHTHGHSHSHHHAGMDEIREVIFALPVCEKVKKDSLAVYQLIAEAESTVHGREITKIHFHEVGAMDAIADIVGSSYLLQRLSAEKIVFSPIATGYGMIKCAHGVLPVPAPATALLLRGVPSYSGTVEGEQCTPTGAALAHYFAKEYGQRPIMKINRIGYGMGTKDFSMANCVRTFLGETE